MISRELSKISIISLNFILGQVLDNYSFEMLSLKRCFLSSLVIYKVIYVNMMVIHLYFNKIFPIKGIINDQKIYMSKIVKAFETTG